VRYKTFGGGFGLKKIWAPQKIFFFQFIEEEILFQLKLKITGLKSISSLLCSTRIYNEFLNLKVTIFFYTFFFRRVLFLDSIRDVTINSIFMF